MHEHLGDLRESLKKSFNMLGYFVEAGGSVLDTQEESSREIENIRRKISEQYQKLLERKK